MDTHSPRQRRFNMSCVRGKDTKPELQLRRGLHSLGMRFRLHVSSLPGSPDLVFPRYKVAVFVNGCFWHGHGCLRSKLPSTRTEFWQTKISRNKARDLAVQDQLANLGWRVLVVWECSLRGSAKRGFPELLRDAQCFIKNGAEAMIEL